MINIRDGSRFPTTSFQFYPNGIEDEKANIAQLSKLTEKQFAVSLDPLNPYLIAEKGDTASIVNLCDRVLGIVVSSANKEEYISPILELDERLQTYLMNATMKYLSGRGEETGSPLVTERRKEYASLARQYERVERENEELGKRVKESVSVQEELLRENRRLQREVEELRKIEETIEPLSARIRREADIMYEIDSFKDEIKELRQRARTAEREKQEESERLVLETEKVQEARRLLKSAEVSAQQFKKKLIAVTEENKELNKVLDQMGNKCNQVREAENRLMEVERKLEDTSRALLNSQKKCQKFESDLQRSVEMRVNVEKELERALSNEKFWKQKADENEEEIAKVREEIMTLQATAGTGDLLTEKHEAMYKEQVESLEERLKSAQNEVEIIVKNRTFELQKRCEELTKDKAALELNEAERNQKWKGLQKENEKLKEELTEANDLVANINKECNRLKKDRDTLLEISKRAQDSLNELDTLKISFTTLQSDFNKLSQENKELKVELTVATNEKENVSKELSEANECNSDLVKKSMLLQERNDLLKDEVNSMNDKLIAYQSSTDAVNFAMNAQ